MFLLTRDIIHHTVAGLIFLLHSVNMHALKAAPVTARVTCVTLSPYKFLMQARQHQGFLHDGDSICTDTLQSLGSVLFGLGQLLCLAWQSLRPLPHFKRNNDSLALDLISTKTEFELSHPSFYVARGPERPVQMALFRENKALFF